MLGLIFGGVSGLLLTLGFAPFSQAWIAWIALAPMACYAAWRKVSWSDAARIGYFMGLVHFLTSLAWLKEVSSLGWVVLSIYLALYPMLWMMFWSRCVSDFPSNSLANLKRALLGACAWVAIEWLRGWLFTGFPWNFIGVTQHSVIPIIQIADLGGVLLVSWLVAFVSLIFALSLKRFYDEIFRAQPLRTHFDFFTAVFLVVLAFAYGVRQFHHPLPRKTELRFLAIQPNIPQDPWQQAPVAPTLQTLQDLTEKGLAASPQPPHLILWPETPISVSVFEDPLFNAIATELTRKTSAALLLGSNDYAVTRVYNSAVLFQKEETQIYHKRHLVLMGEYVPFAQELPFLRRLVPPGVDFSTGEEPTVFILAEPSLKFAPLICFEDIFSDVVSRTLSANPDFFVNLTNDGWFRRTAAAQQHFDNALFRAVEHRRPLLRVTNNGVTAAINELGIPLQILRDETIGDVHTTGFLIGTLPIPEPQITPYDNWGNWVPKLGLVIIFVAVFFSTRRKRRAV